MVDRVLTGKEMCRVKFDENFRGDPQLVIDDTSRKYLYIGSGAVAEEYQGYSDPERQRQHSRFWGLSRTEMYKLLWEEHRARCSRGR